MKYDFLRDAQAEAWASHIRREPYHRRGPTFTEAILAGLSLGLFVICVYLALNGG